MTHDPNPYSPPELLDDRDEQVDESTVPRMPPGILICPWCRQRVAFALVYLSSSSKIECPHCGQVFQRKKRGLAPGVSEFSLFVAIFWIPLAVGLLTLSPIWLVVSLFFALPVFLLADFLVDRQVAYLAKPKK